MSPTRARGARGARAVSGSAAAGTAEASSNPASTVEASSDPSSDPAGHSNAGKAEAGKAAGRFRIAVIGDIHGNVAALDAALTAIEKAKPDAIAVLGDLVMNGPRPAEVIARIRTLDAAGAYVIQGNTDIAVADLDLGAAFPWLDVVPPHQIAAAEWAHDRLSTADLDYLRKLPAERRIRVGDQLVLVCHGSPGSQTDGLAADLDPSVTIQRITRTDARVILCGHTHVAEWREFGRRLVCNPGSCGYAFDGDAGAAWALVTLELPKPETIAMKVEATADAEAGATTDEDAEATAEGEATTDTDADAEAGATADADAGATADAHAGATAGAEADFATDFATDPETDFEDDADAEPTPPAVGPAITVELRRAAYDPLPTADEVSARGLPGDVYRAATIRTGRYVR